MSCSSSWPTARRRLCAAALAWPLLGTARGQAAAPSPIAALSLRRWGSGEFRRFGFLIYEATLWAGEADPPRPPLALQLTYQRAISGRAIAQASVEQMRRFGPDPARLTHWGQAMEALFPDVQAGDRLLGQQLDDQARFFFNDRPLGVVDDAEFAAAFFAIWLDARTSAPALRAALLQRAAP